MMLHILLGHKNSAFIEINTSDVYKINITLQENKRSYAIKLH